MKLNHLQSLGLFIGGFVVAAAAHAQAATTWVSGVGDDANSCGRTDPCKTFAGAIANTAAGGTVRVLDPGGFGSATINKSITIEGLPGASHVINSNVNGLVINAAPTDVVVLRNLNIEGVNGTPPSGVRVIAAGQVVLQDVSLQHQAVGVNIDAGAGAVRVHLHKVKVTASGTGVRNQSATASVAFQGGVLRGNGIGIAADGGQIVLSGASLLHNTWAFSQINGTVLSTGDNVFLGNGGTQARTRRLQTN